MFMQFLLLWEKGKYSFFFYVISFFLSYKYLNILVKSLLTNTVPMSRNHYKCFLNKNISLRIFFFVENALIFFFKNKGTLIKIGWYLTGDITSFVAEHVNEHINMRDVLFAGRIVITFFKQPKIFKSDIKIFKIC